MTKNSDPTLAERAGYLYRHLLLLQRIFQISEESDPANSRVTDGQALREGICDVLDELVEQAHALTAVPLPLRDWRTGDGPDDERWRALTEVERRETLSLVAAYENLIAWCEGHLSDGFEQANGTSGHDGRVRSRLDPNGGPDVLEAERARLARYRRDMAFLDRRRGAEAV